MIGFAASVGDRTLYLALPLSAFADLFEGDQFAQILLENDRLNLLVFNPQTEDIVQWLP